MIINWHHAVTHTLYNSSHWPTANFADLKLRWIIALELAPSRENIHPEHCSGWSHISQKKMLLQEQNLEMNVNNGLIDEFISV